MWVTEAKQNLAQQCPKYLTSRLPKYPSFHPLLDLAFPANYLAGHTYITSMKFSRAIRKRGGDMRIWYYRIS